MLVSLLTYASISIRFICNVYCVSCVHSYRGEIEKWRPGASGIGCEKFTDASYKCKCTFCVKNWIVLFFRVDNGGELKVLHYAVEINLLKSVIKW
jgi:hypothetical protein